MHLMFLSIIPAATFASLLTPEADACTALCHRVTGGERTSFCNPDSNTCENLFEYDGVVLFLDQPGVEYPAVTCVDAAARQAIGSSSRKRERDDEEEDEFIRSAPAERVGDAIAMISYMLASQLTPLVHAFPDVQERAIMQFDFFELWEAVTIVMSAHPGAFAGEFDFVFRQFQASVGGMVGRVISNPAVVRDDTMRSHFVSECMYVLQMLTLAAHLDNTEVAQLVESLQTHLPDTFGAMDTTDELFEALMGSLKIA
jgi:hypothetical protein